MILAPLIMLPEDEHAYTLNLKHFKNFGHKFYHLKRETFMKSTLLYASSKYATSCFTLILVLIGSAQAAPINIFNTGVDANGDVVTGGTVGDEHYTLISDPNGTITGIKTATAISEGYPIGPWLGDNSLSSWIGPNTDNLVGPGGLFTYQTTFDLNGLDHTTASILGRWATDDQGIDILINGTATGNTSASFGVFTDFTINSGFIAGVNTLDFVVTNGHGPTGLRVEITNANAVAVDEPYALALLGLGLLGLGINRNKKT